MSNNSAIEWTDATWNPVTGCTKVSAGCDNCYAERLAHRLLSQTYRATLPVIDTPETRQDPFAVRLWPDRLGIPAQWRQPRRVFVRECFRVMLEQDQHVYQILTKRPSRALRFINERHNDLFDGGAVPGHIWIGTSIENQKADFRARHLLKINARIRFLSCEPLIGPLDLSHCLLADDRVSGIHWVIAGGESGPGARPLDPAWVRNLRDQCLDVSVPFFFKQWGGLTPKAGGRELDGETWSEYPDGEEVLDAAISGSGP
jgi:protein gp37